MCRWSGHLRILAAAGITLALACGAVAEGLASIDLKPANSYAFKCFQDGVEAKSTIRLWVAEDALLIEHRTDSSKVTRLLRPEGTLLLEESSTGSRFAFYGKPFLDSPATLPLQWANHRVIGSPSLEPGGKRLSWTDVSIDPRRDRRVTGDATLDSEGRIRSLIWPSSESPEASITISGWKESVGGLAPKRIDLDLQQAERSKSLAWELESESPMPRLANDFSFEGLLKPIAGQKSTPLSITDCRVSIESCPVFLYNDGAGKLVDQIGSSGHRSLKSPGSNFTAAVILTSIAILFIYAAVRQLRKKKAPEDE